MKFSLTVVVVCLPTIHIYEHVGVVSLHSFLSKNTHGSHQQCLHASSRTFAFRHQKNGCQQLLKSEHSLDSSTSHREDPDSLLGVQRSSYSWVDSSSFAVEPTYNSETSAHKQLVAYLTSTNLKSINQNFTNLHITRKHVDVNSSISCFCNLSFQKHQDPAESNRTCSVHPARAKSPLLYIHFSCQDEPTNIQWNTHWNMKLQTRIVQWHGTRCCAVAPNDCTCNCFPHKSPWHWEVLRIPLKRRYCRNYMEMGSLEQVKELLIQRKLPTWPVWQFRIWYLPLQDRDFSKEILYRLS